MFACKYYNVDNFSTIKILIDNGTNVNLQNDCGYTELFLTLDRNSKTNVNLQDI